MIHNAVQDFLMIGKNKILIQVCEIDQVDLNFYPENPRVYSALNADGTIPSQEDIEEHMKSLEHVRELKEDIKNNGGLMEEIIVRDGDFVVLEGNSRLAAYRILAESDPIRWGKIKCKLLPNDVSEDLIFKLIGQFHIKGKKPWVAFEQANYLYRRMKKSKIDIGIIASDLGIPNATAKKMVEAVKLMKENNEFDHRRYSYYFEYVKDSSIKKYRETNSKIDNTIINQIKTGEIKAAEDIRKLGKIAKLSSKKSKKIVEKIAQGEISLYEAYDNLLEEGKFETSVGKLKKFREYINSETFEKNVKSSDEVYKEANYEIKKIIHRLQVLQKNWEKL